MAFRMGRSSDRAQRSVLWLTVYSVCLALVLSFICFEVMDLDGSDFPVSSNTVTVKLVEPAEHHLRRTVLHGVLQPSVLHPRLNSIAEAAGRIVTDLVLTPVAPTPPPQDRMVLARSSLGEAAA
jgi:hypothetical protein